MNRFSLNHELQNTIKRSVLWTMTTGGFSLGLAFIMAYFEKPVNQGFQNAESVLWWWVNTISGVGSVDASPQTTAGRLFASGVIASGLFLLGIVVSEVTHLIRLTYEHRIRGIIRVRYSNHVVIYGYTSLTAGVIKLLRRHFGTDLKIVLISNEIEANPFPDQVDFIFANPITKGTFIEANTRHASAAIILANDRFQDPDAYSLVIASGIENDNSNVVTLVELMNPEMKSLFKKTNIDAFIDRKELLQDLLEKKESPKLVRIINKQTILNDNELVEEPLDLV